MNVRISVPMWLSQQPWSTDRIEYNWLQRMHLLTNSLCIATPMPVHGTSAEHSVKLIIPAEGAPRLQACINAVELRSSLTRSHWIQFESSMHRKGALQPQ